MHISAHQNGKLFVDLYCIQDHCRILDVSSYNMNGTLREFRREGMDYVGVDMAAGPGVDMVMPSPDEIPFGDNEFDAVVTTSTCEHAAHFWLLLLEMIRVVKPGGYIYINAPSNGAFHQYPFDYWRFYPDAGLAFVDWARKNGHVVGLVESGICRQGAEQWSDFVAVLQKADRVAHGADFISTSGEGFLNVRLYNREGILNLSNDTEDQLKLKSLQCEFDETRRRLAKAEKKLNRRLEIRLARWWRSLLGKRVAGALTSV